MTTGGLARLCLVLTAVIVAGGCSDDRDSGLTTEAFDQSVVLEHETIEVFDAEGRPIEPASGDHLPDGDTSEELLRDAAE